MTRPSNEPVSIREFHASHSPLRRASESPRGLSTIRGTSQAAASSQVDAMAGIVLRLWHPPRGCTHQPELPPPEERWDEDLVPDMSARDEVEILSPLPPPNPRPVKDPAPRLKSTALPDRRLCRPNRYPNISNRRGDGEVTRRWNRSSTPSDRQHRGSGTAGMPGDREFPRPRICETSLHVGCMMGANFSL